MSTATSRGTRPRTRPAPRPSGTTSPGKAEPLWQDLTCGRIGIKRRYDERGRRFLVLKPLNKASRISQLSERERQAVGYRAYGQQLKRIAEDLGVTESTINQDLARARKRLGVASDVDLSAIFATWPPSYTIERRPKSKTKPPSVKQLRDSIDRNAFRAPRGLRWEPSPKGTEPVISFQIPKSDWRQTLTPAELSVAEHALAGLSSPQIASKRGADIRTIANQIAAIYKKLGVSSRLELSLYTLAGRQAVKRGSKSL